MDQEINKKRGDEACTYEGYIDNRDFSNPIERNKSNRNEGERRGELKKSTRMRSMKKR